MSTIEAILKATKDHTAHGRVVHPLTRPTDPVTSFNSKPGKIPVYGKGWEQLTKTPDDIGTYIKKGYNIGLVCGKASGLIVLDLDHYNFIAEIFKGCGDIETMRSKRTEGRGHMYFKYTPDLPASKHDKTLGLEVLSDGNNVVLAPSVHVSGEVYRSNNVLPVEMPQILIDNIKRLIETEAELKQLLAPCRGCFRSVLKDYPANIPDISGADGREYMLAICTDLKAKGAADKHALMFARLIFREKYNEVRSLTEWRNIGDRLNSFDF